MYFQHWQPKYLENPSKKQITALYCHNEFTLQNITEYVLLFGEILRPGIGYENSVCEYVNLTSQVVFQVFAYKMDTLQKHYRIHTTKHCSMHIVQWYFDGTLHEKNSIHEFVNQTRFRMCWSAHVLKWTTYLDFNLRICFI